MEESAKWTWEHSTVNYIPDLRFNFLFSYSRNENSAFQSLRQAPVVTMVTESPY